MEFPEFSSIRIHTQDDRSWEVDEYEWGDFGIMFEVSRVNFKQRLLVPWSNIAFIVTDLEVGDA